MPALDPRMNDLSLFPGRNSQALFSRLIRSATI